MQEGLNTEEAGKAPRPARAWLYGVAVCLATLAVWHGVVRVPFDFDDAHAIRSDVEIRRPGNIFRFLAPSQFLGRGLLKAGFALSYSAGGALPGGEPDPSAFHAAGLAIHVINAGLVFWLIWIVLRRA